MYASPKRSALISGLVHAGVIVLVLVATKAVAPPVTNYFGVPLAERDISAYVPPVFRTTGGGGGGGRELTPASKGELPRRATRQFVPPTVHSVENPRLPMEATIVAPEISMASMVKNVGDPNGILGALSDGLGRNGGIGNRGKGGGVGESEGPGAGPDGRDGGVSGMSPVRGYLTPASLVTKIEPEYSEEARKAKLQGTVVLQIEVDAGGRARSIVVARSLGLGLDEKAVEAVKKWRFRPATQAGKPVATPAVVEVNFRLL